MWRGLFGGIGEIFHREARKRGEDCLGNISLEAKRLKLEALKYLSVVSWRIVKLFKLIEVIIGEGRRGFN